MFHPDDLYLKICSLVDISILSKVGYESYRAYYLYLWTDTKYADWYMNISFSEASLQKQMQVKGTLLFLIYQSQIPIGLIKLNAPECDNNIAQDIELEKIYLLEKYTGKGVGQWALNEIIKIAGRQNKQKILLKSMDTSKAMQFYIKAGFVETGKLRLDYKGFREEYRNMAVMELII